MQLVGHDGYYMRGPFCKGHYVYGYSQAKHSATFLVSCQAPEQINDILPEYEVLVIMSLMNDTIKYAQ